MHEIIAPMAAKVFDIKVKPGDTVDEGEEVLILEAMKMEMPLVADEGGTVKAINCQVGDAVEAQAVLAVIE
jgi:biotin carboxyl carrier protein